MPASSTFAAPYGRVMSGRGFAPSSYQAHDLPAAGQITRDVPDVSVKSNARNQMQQAQFVKSLQLLRQGMPIPSALSGAAFAARDEPELHHPAKRPRLAIPEYGRSASDPPLSFARRNANAMDMPVEALRLEAMRAHGRLVGLDIPPPLRSVQSGPSRTDSRPSPNCRIYSNAFKGSRDGANGVPANYSRAKATPINAQELSGKAPPPSSGGGSDPTPHPALLKQPLLGKRPSSSGPGAAVNGPAPALSSAHRQQPDQATRHDSSQRMSHDHMPTAEADLTARLQHMQSLVRQGGNPSMTASPKAPAHAPPPEVMPSPKASPTHESDSNADSEMDDSVSHGVSHGSVQRVSHSPEAAAAAATANVVTSRQSSEEDRSKSANVSAAPIVAREQNMIRQSSQLNGQLGRDSASASPRKSEQAAFDDSHSSQRRAETAQMPSRDSYGPQQGLARDHKADARQHESEQRSQLPSQLPSHSNGIIPSRKPTPVTRPNMAPNKGDADRPWSNLSSALQPSASQPSSSAQDVNASLQHLMAGCLKKSNGHREEAMLPMSDANMQQLLDQLHHLSEAAAAGKNGQRAALPPMSAEEQPFAQHSNLPRPIQAQLHVMRDSFNRLARPQMGDHPQLPALSSGAASAPFPPSGFPPNSHEQLRSILAPNQGPGMLQNGAAKAFPPHVPLPISSSTRSSLPPSVASWLEQEQQQRRQMTNRSHMGISQQAGVPAGMIPPPHMSQAHQLTHHDSGYEQAHTSRGYAQSSRPLDSVRITGSKDWYDTLGNGNSLPSRVVGEAGVRNPALLNRPVLASHRDPQPGSLQQGLGFPRARVQQAPAGLPQALPGRGFEGLNGSLAAQRAQHESSFDPRTAGGGFPPIQSYGQPYTNSASASVQALAAMLGNSNMLPADMTQLASIAGNTHAGNLNQLISQLQMATQLAQSQGEPHEPLVETTHRVVIPAAHLKEGSHAIARANMAAQQGGKTGATVADGGNFSPQQGRAPAAKAPEPKTALDVVAEAAVEAAEANNEEPSELLMLAAETLAGLNSMQPRSSEDHPRSGGMSPDHSGNDSPPAVQKLSKQPNERKQKMKKTIAVHKPASQRHSDSSAASPQAVSGSASMHPILGFNVPHARRSYHRDGMANGKAGDSGQAPSANGQSLPIGLARGSPPKGRQRKALPSSSGHARTIGPLHRVPSDSSMTVSADSNA